MKYMFQNTNLLLVSDIEFLHSRLDFYTRGYYFLQSRNRDLARRNANLRREIRSLRATVEDHEDFIFGPILFDFE
jgi:hypothetical protein